MKPQHDPSLIDKVPPSIVSAAMAVSNWFNSQSLHPSPRWEFLSICSRNHADRLKKLERELNAANTIIRQQQLLDEENLRLQERIKRLEDAGDAMAKDFAHFWTDRNSVRDWPKAKEAKL